MSGTSQTRLDNRNFFWVWFVAVNATLLVAALWVVAIGLLAPLIGLAGAFLSLFFAKWLAIKAHGIRVIEPALFRSDAERELHAIVSDVATRAGLETVPAVGVYDSPDVNAFATGASQSRSLVAFSSQLLAKLTPAEITAVVAHEVAHIANRDMLAIVLLQGAINSIVLAVVAPLNLFRVANLFSDRFSLGAEVCLWLAKTAVALALTFVGGLMVKAFSRRREFRADALAARIVGHDAMIGALTAIAKDDAAIPRGQLGYAAFKIAGRSPWGEFFSTHPTLERRVVALRTAVPQDQV